MPTPILSGVGYHVPEQRITNADLEKLMDTSDAWIQERTGIQERRYAVPGKDTTSGMGTKAAEAALEHAGLRAQDIDLLVFATLSPDYYFPGSGVLVQRNLQMPTIPCLDVRAQCSGFIYGLSIAQQYIRTGEARNVLVIGAESQTCLMELSDRGRNVAVIFGDGAGAAVLKAGQTDDSGALLATSIHAQGQFAEELYLRHPGTLASPRLTPGMLTDGSMLPVMNGPTVFKHAVTRFEEAIRDVHEKAGKSVDQLDVLIPHQANLRISQAIQKKLGLEDHQVVNNVQQFGNTTAASIPIALAQAWQEGRIQPGHQVCMAAFGSGFTWGSALVQF